jgi:hypothetical protein
VTPKVTDSSTGTGIVQLSYSPTRKRYANNRANPPGYARYTACRTVSDGTQCRRFRRNSRRLASTRYGVCG